MSQFLVADLSGEVMMPSMADPRRRTLVLTLVGLGVVWLLALAGYGWFRSAKVTADKVIAYLQSTDVAALQGIDREEALKQLAAMMNSLTMEERRRARWQGGWNEWFAQLTEEEKAGFLEATMPTGFRQMLESFEQLPEEKRARAVQDSLRRLQRARDTMEQEEGWGPPEGGQTNRPPPLSPELQEKVVRIGLKSFYSESSAQTKAELAPVLEEMQRLMERGYLFRGDRR